MPALPLKAWPKTRLFGFRYSRRAPSYLTPLTSSQSKPGHGD